MSLRAIELQVAIPRTQSVGKIQDQLQQRGQVMQDHLGLEQKKDDDHKRKQVLETSETDKKRLSNDDESNQGQKNDQRKNKENKSNEKHQNAAVAKHPYKGNFIDFSG
ncbi:hypothetical protein DS745_16665 [Anaerobacillus alkaliphilus]|uniref:RNA polymerase subunit sigma n=1 Tax=Anaerobacillus alkaliphilus TaxID=1548597 RepID=A0A4Q0VNJ5_9BACI|nr:hypothetical protein [Anaerobacillus alkaliphilus]RXI97982.1 hypothetical protein DS745_16665 [Anaerobacillus alkaliphilus]